MKICPQCQRTYDDNTLNFCLDDGSILNQASVPSNDPPETVIMNPPQTTGQNQALGTQANNQNWDNSPRYQSPQSSGSKSWMWVLGILIGLVVLCGGGLVGLIAIGSLAEDDDDPVANVTPKTSQTPIAKDAPRDGRRLISSHDFSKWNIKGNSNVSANYSSGELVLTSKVGYFYVILTKNYLTFDGSVKLTLRNTTGEASSLGYGLVVHSDPKKVIVKDYAFLIRSDNQQYRVVRHTNKRESNVVDWTRSSAINRGTESNVLEIRAEGKDMKFYINGKFVRTVKDFSNYKEGVAGIYTSGNVPIGFSKMEYRK